MVAMGSALVLGGGGQAGIAWITGLLAGLAEAGQDVTGADLVIGTSAGATVAAQLGSGLGLDELFARQVEPALQSRELMVELDLAKFGAEIQPYMARAVSPEDTLRQFGRFALDAQTVPEAERRAVVEGRLPSTAWPATPTKLIAVDCGSGTMTAFDAASGVSLVDAVAASAAVPGRLATGHDRRPAVHGRRGPLARQCRPGGGRGADHGDLAVGHGLRHSRRCCRCARRWRRCRPAARSVTVVSPDEASVAAIGTNALDPATRAPAATAGRAQGRAGLPPAL